MSRCKRKAEYWREWRKIHREQYLANQRKRYASMTPEKRAALLAAKKEWRRKHDPNYGVGRGHYKHKSLWMTDEERKAHRAALVLQWRLDHPEAVREYARRLLANPVNRYKKRIYNSLYEDRNYQKILEKSREKNKRRHDKNRKREYKPRMSLRIPEWVTCRAHARHIKKLAEARRIESEVSFGMAVQSGLTVGRYAI